MMKFISFKAVVLLGVSFLGIGGAGLLLSMEHVGESSPAPSGGTAENAVLREELNVLEARVILVESRDMSLEDTVALKAQVRELQILVEDLDKQLEHYQKNLDSRAEKKDNIVKVEKQALPKRSPAANRFKYHAVKSGETLYRISKKYAISERDLIRLNGLKNKSRIYVGQRLRVSY